MKHLFNIFLLVIITLFIRDKKLKETRRVLTNKTAEYCQGLASNGIISVSSVQENQANSNRQQVRSIYGQKNILKQYLDDKNIITLLNDVGIKAGPWLIMFIFSLIGWFCYCLCCCCDCCCPPMKCCRRDYEKKPLTKFEERCPQYFLIFCGLLVVASSVAGIIISANVGDGVLSFRCALMTLLDSTANGYVYNGVGWVGVTPMGNRLTTLKTELSAQKSNIDNAFSNANTGFLATDGPAMKTKNAAIKTANEAVTFVTPSAAGGSNITPIGMSTFLTETKTALDTLFTSVGDAATTVLNNLVTSSNTVSGAVSSINTSLDAAQTPISELSSSLNSQLSTMSDTLAPVFFLMILKDFLIFMLYFIVTLVLGALPAIVIILIIIFNFKRLRVLIHFSWCVVCLLMCVGFILAFILFPLTLLTMDFCEIFNELITVQAKFTDGKLIPTSITNQVTICFFGDGDMGTTFNIASQMTQLTSMTSGFSALDSMTTVGSSNYIDLSLAVTGISNVILTYQSYQKGYPAKNGNQNQALSDSAASDDKNPIVALANLNAKTDLNACTGFYDQFVFDFIKCQTNYNQWSGSAGTDNNVANSKYCIKISDFTAAFSQARYAACAQQASITTMITNLKGWDADKTTKYGTLIGASGSTSDDYEGLKTAQQSFNTKLSNLITTAQSLKTQMQTLINNVADPSTGLASGLNCQFLKFMINNVYKSICVALNVPLYTLCVFLLIDSFAMFLMSYYAYKVGLRLSKNTNQVLGFETQQQEQQIELTKVAPSKYSSQNKNNRFIVD